MLSVILQCNAHHPHHVSGPKGIRTQPWSGHYDVSPVLWATAHVTQHTPIGWQPGRPLETNQVVPEIPSVPLESVCRRYLPVGSGSGELPRGGYYTTLVEPDGRNFTIQVRHTCAVPCIDIIAWRKVSDCLGAMSYFVGVFHHQDYAYTAWKGS